MKIQSWERWSHAQGFGFLVSVALHLVIDHLYVVKQSHSEPLWASLCAQERLWSNLTVRCNLVSETFVERL